MVIETDKDGTAMWGSREWPDIGPDDLLVACGECIDASGRHEGVFVIDEGPEGAIVGRVARSCPHTDAPPDIPSAVHRYLASWRRLPEHERQDPTHVVIQEISLGGAPWVLGRRVDVLRVDHRAH